MRYGHTGFFKTGYIGFMANTLGTHIILTTFGSWLHGDPRGSWKDGCLIGADPFLETHTRKRMNDEAVVLSHAECVLVGIAFGRIIKQHEYRAFAATIQDTHAHLVMAPTTDEIALVYRRLKKSSADAVMRVRRNMCRATPRSLWTEGRFPVYLFDESHLQNAIEYVRGHNRRTGQPADPHPWIDPI